MVWTDRPTQLWYLSPTEPHHVWISSSPPLLHIIFTTKSTTLPACGVAALSRDTHSNEHHGPFTLDSNNNKTRKQTHLSPNLSPHSHPVAGPGSENPKNMSQRCPAMLSEPSADHPEKPSLFPCTLHLPSPASSLKNGPANHLSQVLSRTLISACLLN